jgi:hypothetical protein
MIEAKYAVSFFIYGCAPRLQSFFSASSLSAFTMTAMLSESTIAQIIATKEYMLRSSSVSCLHALQSLTSKGSGSLMQCLLYFAR